jgi:hypothetical protein
MTIWNDDPLARAGENDRARFVIGNNGIGRTLKALSGVTAVSAISVTTQGENNGSCRAAGKARSETG